jgi:hypothetical protein
MNTNDPKGPRDSNPDPITGEPGAHPVGVAGGGTGGALAGAAIGGAVGGPVGALVGGAIGAVGGGFAGKAAAETVDPTQEDAHWRAEHPKRAWGKDKPYEHYEPAYRYGWESAANPDYATRDFATAEPHLSRDWSTRRGNSTSNWEEVKDATREAYERARSRMSRN